MKTTAIKLLNPSGFILIWLLLFSVMGGYSQTIFWLKSLDWAKEIAKEKNKLIIADFRASWYGPCLALDKQVWSNSTISALAQNFVCMRFDLSDGFNNAYPYTVDRIPEIMIPDYQGNIFFTKTSFVYRPELQKILASFPADVQLLYQAMAELNTDKENPMNLLFEAVACQYYAKNTVAPAKDIFIRESDQMPKKARKISERVNDSLITERINLILAQNQVIKGRPDKGNDEVMKLPDYLREENLSLAYYILVSAFLQSEDKDSAMKYYNDLKMSNGSEAFVQMVRKVLE